MADPIHNNLDPSKVYINTINLQENNLPSQISLISTAPIEHVTFSHSSPYTKKTELLTLWGDSSHELHYYEITLPPGNLGWLTLTELFTTLKEQSCEIYYNNLLSPWETYDEFETEVITASNHVELQVNNENTDKPEPEDENDLGSNYTQNPSKY